MKTWIILVAVLVQISASNSQTQPRAVSTPARPSSASIDTASSAAKHLVTFIELGSVKCIPCKAMQPVMRSIEKKYARQIKVLFYDVWQEEQKRYAEEYGIRLIPTQVFLDKNGKEFFRHEGFYPEEDIDKLLQKQGLKSLDGG